jgi:phosphoglycolate phosphatase
VNSEPGRPRAILFDWDNTLVDSWPVIHQALGATFEAMGHEPWSFEQTKINVRLSLRDSFPKMFGDRWQDAMKVFYGAFEQTHIEKLKPLAGAAEMLRSLSSAGLYLAIVSNKTGRYLRKESSHLGWEGLFAQMVGAGDAAQDKPAAEALLLALDGSEFEPGPAVWFVGDSGIDMEIAHRTRCVPVLLHRADKNAEEFAQWPPARYFEDCMALEKHIFQE